MSELRVTTAEAGTKLVDQIVLATTPEGAEDIARIVRAAGHPARVRGRQVHIGKSAAETSGEATAPTAAAAVPARPAAETAPPAPRIPVVSTGNASELTRTAAVRAASLKTRLRSRIKPVG
jgi:hypothetical protein